MTPEAHCMAVLQDRTAAAPVVVSAKTQRSRLTRGDLLDAPADRVIAQARLVLCALSLIALQLDPVEPNAGAQPVYIVLQAYFAFAAVMVYARFRLHLPPALQYVVHGTDIAFISTLMVLTEGPISPFFLFFTFILLSATMRWNWPAVVATAAVMALVLLATS